MAKLVIKKDGQYVVDQSLDTSREYIAGRSKDCDIHLDEVTVSRQHLKIFFRDNAWHVQTLSKYSPLYLNNEPVDYSVLKEGDSIKVVNYTFIFSQSSTEAQVQTPEPSITNPVIDSETPTPYVEAPQEPAYETEDLDEKTFVPESSSQDWSIGIPYLILRTGDSASKTLRLEGDYWIIGRDDACDIIIEDLKSSREHCEIYKKNQSYYLQDKGSSNGTLLNGNQVVFKKEYPLKSGDNIQIGQTILTFEIRDPHFQEKLALIPIDQTQPLNEPLYHSPTMYTDSPQKVVRIEPQKKKPTTFYAILGVLALALVYGLTQDNSQKTDLASKNNNNPSSELIQPIDALSPDQKDFVEKTYVLAQNLYKQGKYELALLEIQKIHGMLPEYKDTKDIEKFSKVAIDTLMEQQEIKRQEEEQVKLAQKVSDIIDSCEQNYRANLNSSSLDQCLLSAEELDPENNRIRQLKILAEQNDSQKEAQLAQKEAYRAQVARRKSLFNKADELKRRGKILDAIAAHNRNIASTLPDPENLETKSKQEIQSLQAKIQADLKRLSDEAASAYGDKNYKLAIKKLEEAIKLNPQDRDIKEQHSKYFQELYKIVKALYGDSVLEENLGNVESAKEKWKKIQDLDVEYGEYFKKSKLKLKKYGS